MDLLHDAHIHPPDRRYLFHERFSYRLYTTKMPEQCKPSFLCDARDLLKGRFKSPAGAQLFMITYCKPVHFVSYPLQKKRRSPAVLQAKRRTYFLDKDPVRVFGETNGLGPAKANFP